MNNIKGFTLIEVLVSLTIVAVAMTALMMSLTELTHRQSLLKQKELALITANNVLLKTQLGLIPLNQTTGHETQLNHEFTWKVLHYPTKTPGVQRITVDVSEKDESIISLEGFKKVILQ